MMQAFSALRVSVVREETMNRPPQIGPLAGTSVVALVFVIALTLATLQLPVILGNWLSRYCSGIHPITEPQKVAELMAVARPVAYPRGRAHCRCPP